MTARMRGVPALLGAAVLLGACSNHSGLRKLRPTAEPGSVVASAPSGLAGSAAASTSAKPSATRTRASSASLAAGSTAAAATTRSVHHRPAGASSTSRPPSTRPVRSSTAAAAPIRPGLGAAPDSGLNGGQRVRVTGTRFASGSTVTLRECRTASGSCPLYLGRASADTDGSFTLWVWVSSIVGIDSCGKSGCMVAALHGDGSTAASVRISFG
jgi:hypothetical protein